MDSIPLLFLASFPGPDDVVEGARDPPAHLPGGVAAVQHLNEARHDLVVAQELAVGGGGRGGLQRDAHLLQVAAAQQRGQRLDALHLASELLCAEARRRRRGGGGRAPRHGRVVQGVDRRGEAQQARVVLLETGGGERKTDDDDGRFESSRCNPSSSSRGEERKVELRLDYLKDERSVRCQALDRNVQRVDLLAASGQFTNTVSSIRVAYPEVPIRHTICNSLYTFPSGTPETMD